MKNSWTALVLLYVLCIPAIAQRGAYVAPRTLPQLATQAETIIRGYVASAFVEPHPEFRNLQTVVVTIRVAETLKGNAGASYTFRQFIWDIRDRYDAAGYRKGEEVLLMMNAPNGRGLTSPAGMQQGRFRVLRDAEGKATATNGNNNVGLFDGLTTARQDLRLSAAAAQTVSTHQQGPVALDQLQEVVREVLKK